MRNRFITTALLICLGLPNPAVLAEPPEQLRYVNVELNSDGFLIGQAVEKSGRPIPGVTVQLTDGHKTFAAPTDANGKFRFRINACRTCVLQMEGQFYGCRVWQAHTAPLKSIRSIALVNENPAVTRGNMFDRFRRHPAECRCEECQSGHLSADAKYGMVILAGGAVAAYMAFSRDNGS